MQTAQDFLRTPPRIRREISRRRSLPLPTVSVRESPSLEAQYLERWLRSNDRRLLWFIAEASSPKARLLEKVVTGLERSRMHPSNEPHRVEAVVRLGGASQAPVSASSLVADLRTVLATRSRTRTGSESNSPDLGPMLAGFADGLVLIWIDSIQEELPEDLLCVLKEILESEGHSIRVIVSSPDAQTAGTRNSLRLPCALVIDPRNPTSRAEMLRSLDVKGSGKCATASSEELEALCGILGDELSTLQACVGLLAIDAEMSVESLLRSISKMNPTEARHWITTQTLEGLDPTSRLAMVGLAVYGRSVPAVGVDYLFCDQRPEFNCASTLTALVRRKVVDVEGDGYRLPAATSALLRHSLADGTDDSNNASGTSIAVSLSRLQERGVQFFRACRRPQAEWGCRAAIEPLLGEFALRQALGQADAVEVSLILIGLKRVAHSLSNRNDPDARLAYSEYLEIASSHPSEAERISSDQIKRIASQHCKYGDFDRADRAYQHGLVLHPKNGNLHGVYAYFCLSDLGDVDRALHHFELADDDTGNARNTRANHVAALVAAHRFQEAREISRSLLQSQPQPDRSTLKGLVLYALCEECEGRDPTVFLECANGILEQSYSGVPWSIRTVLEAVSEKLPPGAAAFYALAGDTAGMNERFSELQATHRWRSLARQDFRILKFE